MDDSSITQTGYRLPRNHLAVGVVGVLSFAAMDVVSTVVAYWNIDGSFRYPKPTALAVGTFWSALTLMSVWIILAYFRERLFLDKTKIIQHGIIRSKVIRVDEVTRVKWRLVPRGGTVVIRSVGMQLKIYLGNFVPRQREEVISFLHNEFRSDIQEGWSEFEEAQLKANRKRDEKSASAAVICALIFFGFAGIWFYCWTRDAGARCLVMGVASVGGGLWYLWRLRGHWKRQSAQCSA